MSSNPGGRVKDLRKGRRWTQTTLADELNMLERPDVRSGTSNVSMIESGDVAMSLSMAGAMADVFRVSIDYLAGRTDDPTPCWPGNGRLVVQVESEEQRKVLEEWVHFLLPLPLDMLKMMLASLQGLRRELGSQGNQNGN